MATRSVRLIFKHAADPDKNVTITVPKCDDTKTPAELKAVMQTIFNNAEVFSLDLGAPESAAWITPMQLDEVVLPA